MPIFISYNREDSKFADKLARNLAMRKYPVWMDRWELNIGDSLIDKIQKALSSSVAILVILSRNSVDSEWCKKELNSGLMRELAEKTVLLLPCVIDDCEIPLFLREKLYADFRQDYDKAFKQIEDSLLRITNRQQRRIENSSTHTDMSYDWKERDGRWRFDWTFVDHGADIEYSVLTRCLMTCNDIASLRFQAMGPEARQEYIRRALGFLVDQVSGGLKIQLSDAFEKSMVLTISGSIGEAWFVRISSRRMGIDNGKDTLVHVDQILERALEHTKGEDHGV